MVTVWTKKRLRTSLLCNELLDISTANEININILQEKLSSFHNELTTPRAYIANENLLAEINHLLQTGNSFAAMAMAFLPGEKLVE